MIEQRKSNIYTVFLGIFVLIALYSIYKISFYFTDKNYNDPESILLFISILIFSSVIYLISIKIIKIWNIYTLIIIILFGLLFRILFIYSQPILEDDYNRYLWDGAVLANNSNPYKYSPKEVMNGKADTNLINLAGESADTIKNINHPHLKTIYPPIAQLIFAASYKISPWNITAWKFILLLFDVISLILIILTLIKLKIPLINILIYWWNPLLIKEIFNSGHMDIIVFPFVLGSLLIYLKNKNALSGLLISIGAGIKIWPIFIFPAYIKTVLKEPKKLILTSFVFIISLLLIFSPILLLNLDTSSGFIAYGKSWENNSSIFKIILSTTELLLNSLDIHLGHAQTYSRAIVTVLLGIWIFYISFLNKSQDIYKKALYIIAFAYLISPTQFPWYYSWLIPFLAIKPRWSLILLTVLLPLYYLQYYFEYTNTPELFDNYIVWIEFAPVWILIIMEYFNKKLLFNRDMP